MGESLLAVGYFAGVARGHDVLVAAVDDVADDEVGGDNSDVGKNIGGDEPDASFERFLIVDSDTAIPSGKAEKFVTT